MENTNKPLEQVSVEELTKALELAKSKEQPFMATDSENKPVIVGDVTQTDSESDYTVDFEYPEALAKQFDNAIKLPNGRYKVSKTYKSVSITPRKEGRLRHDVSVLLSNLSKVNEFGQQEFYTVGELAKVYGVLSSDVVDSMENIVAITLGLNEIDIEYIPTESLVGVAVDIISNNSGFFQ